MKIKLALFYLFLLLFVSCGKDDDPIVIDPPDPPEEITFLNFSLTTINFTSQQDASLVAVRTNKNWTATCTANWITLSTYSGVKSTSFIIGATENRKFSRETVITISADNITKEIKVIQSGVTLIKFEIKRVSFTLLPVKADTAFYLDGTTYLASREVYLDSYYISETEITNAQWEAVMGSLPYSTENSFPNFPVIVNWNTINEEFIPRLNELVNYELRLPTENEWEVAARGGKKSNNTVDAGSINIDEVAWYYQNSGGRKHNVALKKPNELGLYDMSGNVSEWCSDWYMEWTETNLPPAVSSNPTGPATGTEKVIRGGDFLAERFEYDRNSCSVRSRNYLPPNITETDFLYKGLYHFTGFRIVIAKN